MSYDEQAKIARHALLKAQDEPMLQWFAYAHLPEYLQAVSGKFCDLALDIVQNLPRNAERTVALRKLLESKDAAVRARLFVPPEAAKKEET